MALHSPPSVSPISPTLSLALTSNQRHVPLPERVEGLIEKICRDQDIAPPDDTARENLFNLGESTSTRILKVIEKSKVYKTFSAFVMYLTKKPEFAVEGSPARDSGGFLFPSVREDCGPSFLDHGIFEPGSASTCQLTTVDRNIVNSSPTAPTTPQPVCLSTTTSLENYGTVRRRLSFTGPDNIKSSPLTASPTCQQKASAHMLVLGELEFWKAFLILSYIGRTKLEDAVPLEFIQSLKYMPMESFEIEIYNKFGRYFIESSDRRKNFQWDTSKTYVYQCHVDIIGNVTFKGPFPEPNETHLQRMLGDDNILQVKFEETKEQKNPHYAFYNYCDVYQRVAQEGIMLGLRRYKFLVYKDGGKEEKKKNSTSSSVKCYFVRTDSGWAMDRGTDFLCGKTVNEIRLAFMHIHKVPSLAKYMPRFSLILSKTLKLKIDLSIVNVDRIDDIPCMDGSTTTKGIHTDGTGFISHDLALQCPCDVFKGKIQTGAKGSYAMEGPSSSKKQRSHYNEEPPLLMQVRLFYKGLTAKGTLLVNRKLPPNSIQIRRSMIKVKSDPSIRDIQSINSVEVVTTSYRPKKVHLSRFLISLLHYGGVPSEFFLGLLSGALVKIENRFSDRDAAINIVRSHSGIDDDDLMLKMLYAKIPLDEPFLKSRLSMMMGDEHKGLQEGKIPISNTWYLMGTADPTGILGSNQVCVVLDEGQLSGEVLVYKHPGLHTGDIHKLQATYIPELEGIVGNSKYAIFFPVVGPRSLADEMANSDFDGDIYWVSQNPELVKNFTPSKPWVAPEEDLHKKDAEQYIHSNLKNDELERVLFGQFLKNRFDPSYAIGMAADYWLSYMDLVLSPDFLEAEERKRIETKMEELVNLYYDALDASKTGKKIIQSSSELVKHEIKKVQVPNYLKVQEYPHFMDKKSAKKTYHSKSILGVIYDRVESFKTEKLQSTEILRLPCFMEMDTTSCIYEWDYHYKCYLREMSEALGSSNELCPESKDVRNKSCQRVIDKYKEILYGGKEFNSRTRPDNDIYMEACAIYQIVYAKADKTKKANYCGFAWKVAGEALRQLYLSRMGNPVMVDLDVLREARR